MCIYPNPATFIILTQQLKSTCHLYGKKAMRFMGHKEFSHILTAEAHHPEAPTKHPLPDGLPPTLMTSDALEPFRTYFLIPQPSVRRFVLMLLARITDNTDTTHPCSDSSEAEYLLTQYAQLSTDDMRDKVLALP
jgi:hypothetical protein